MKIGDVISKSEAIKLAGKAAITYLEDPISIENDPPKGYDKWFYNVRPGTLVVGIKYVEPGRRYKADGFTLRDPVEFQIQKITTNKPNYGENIIRVSDMLASWRIESGRIAEITKSVHVDTDRGTKRRTYSLKSAQARIIDVVSQMTPQQAKKLLADYLKWDEFSAKETASIMKRYGGSQMKIAGYLIPLDMETCREMWKFYLKYNLV